MSHKSVDANMNFANKLDIEGLIYRDISEAPFRLYGLLFENGEYFRLHEKAAKDTSDNVYDMYKTSTGARLRFVSDSPYVAIRAVLSRTERIPNMTFIGTIGFDLYADGAYAGTFVPSVTENAYEAIVKLPDAKQREFTIHFPLYANLESLEIGLDEKASLAPASDYDIEAPVVFYGSSITNGACASRPGMAYPAQVGRMLNANHHNLGFGGSARGEKAICEYIAAMKMSAFVLDYDYNAYNPEHLEETHEPFFKLIREKNPDLPILMISAPKPERDASWQRRYETIKKTYENAIAAGDKNVYFLDGGAPLREIGQEFLVDGIHPSDLGFYFMAKAVSEILRPILKK